MVHSINLLYFKWIVKFTLFLLFNQQCTSVVVTDILWRYDMFGPTLKNHNFKQVVFIRVKGPDSPILELFCLGLHLALLQLKPIQEQMTVELGESQPKIFSKQTSTIHSRLRKQIMQS